MVDTAIGLGDVQGLNVILVGDADRLHPLLTRQGSKLKNLTLHHASEAIAMDADPLSAVRRLKNSSIHAGLKLVKNREADAFISAGNTGAITTAAAVILGFQPQVRRPALAQFLPKAHGRVLLLDIGAAVPAYPEDLLTFAQLGATFFAQVTGNPNPSIALLNIGTEATKGDALRVETHRLLQASQLNFTGNIEPHELWVSKVDVVVTDGFTGNILLKTGEGLIKTIIDQLRLLGKGSIPTQLAVKWLKPSLRRVFAPYDYQQYGGAPLLGVKGLCLICHGRTTASALRHAVVTARDLVNLSRVR